MAIQQLFPKSVIRPHEHLVFGSGIQKIPILITFKQSGSYNYFMGIDIKYKRVWIRVQVKEPNKICKPGDVVKCKVNLEQIAGFKSCGVPFYDGKIDQVIKFSQSIDRFEYFKKKGYEFEVAVFSVAKICEKKINGQSNLYRFTKGEAVKYLFVNESLLC